MSQKRGSNNVAFILGVTTIASVMLAGPGAANVDQVKIYKKVFPESKPQCIMCHVDKLPKKDEGKHEPNAYGLKIREAKGSDEKITEETYKKVGTFEDFEAQRGQAQEDGK